jgi:hypothetical protein
MSEFIYLQYEKKGKLVCITLAKASQPGWNHEAKQ